MKLLTYLKFQIGQFEEHLTINKEFLKNVLIALFIILCFGLLGTIFLEDEIEMQRFVETYAPNNEIKYSEIINVHH